MKKYTVTSCSYTLHYDNDESLELECDFPGEATLEDLAEDARSICKMAARNDDYFKTMEMKKEPFVSVNEEDGYIDVTFDFVEGDFVTDICVSYSVNTSTLVRVKDVEFFLHTPQDGTLEVIAKVQGIEVGYCFVNKEGEYFGHNGKFATGFDDPEVEKVAQEVFAAEVEEWTKK